MATVMALIAALLFGGNQPTFQMKCSHTEIKDGYFHKISHPLRRATAKLLHTYHCLDSLNLEEDNRLLVATWPTYANQSLVHLAGYTYALPTCANDRISRHGIFESCVGYLGARVTSNQGYMPPDYLSHAVSGAQITLSAGWSKPKPVKAVSGEYGHFQTFASLDEPVGNVALAISTAECSPNNSLQSVLTPSFAQVLPRRGVTIVSDVDDVLRECEVWNPKQMLLNTFARTFQPWSDEPLLNMSSTLASGMNVTIAHEPLGSMPRVYRRWADSIPPDGERSVHFHYVTEAPEMSHQFYIDGIKDHYPPGSFDFRPMILDTYGGFANSRYDSIRRLIETFPHRHFVLVGDTSTPALLESYRRLADEFDQVQCILIRDVGATEPANWFAYDLARYPRRRVLVFRTPNELLTDPKMNVTRLLQVLGGAEGNAVRCGGLRGHETEKGHGRKKAAVWASAKTGVNRYFTCWLLTLSGKRPCKDCLFDRRGLLKYTPTPGRR